MKMTEKHFISSEEKENLLQKNAFWKFFRRLGHVNDSWWWWWVWGHWTRNFEHGHLHFIGDQGRNNELWYRCTLCSGGPMLLATAVTQLKITFLISVVYQTRWPSITAYNLDCIWVKLIHYTWPKIVNSQWEFRSSTEKFLGALWSLQLNNFVIFVIFVIGLCSQLFCS